MEKQTAPFAALLADAVNEDGVLSECYSMFHGFSIGNQMLAWSQLSARQIPLGPIATFKRWQALGRTVKRGEKAIALVMPVTIQKKDESGNKTDDSFQFFTMKNYWFALAQTEGEDFQNEVITPEWNATQALETLNITEESFSLMDGNCQGYAKGRTIAVNPIAAFPHKTRMHEIAHIVLGHTTESNMTDDDRTPRDVREVEAEGVAYILCSILGLPGQTESRGYIQHWLGDAAITDKTAQRIFNAANKILKAGGKTVETE
jgi:hypothetical protein